MSNSWIHWTLIFVFSIIAFVINFIKHMVPWKGTRNNALILTGHPPKFFEGSYSQALAKAREDNKFLLVYLHSSNHVDSPRFCREVLCTEHVSSFLEENFILWGGDISSSEAYRLSHQFRATSYPFFAVVTNVTNSNSMLGYLQSLNYTHRISQSGSTLLYKRQGYITSDSIMQELTDTLEKHEPLLKASKAEREEREQERILMQMQDREFQESLQRDREREQRRLEEENRLRIEEELKIKQDIEREEMRRRDEAERELRRQKEEQEKLEREKRREILSKTLPPEPEKSDKTTDLIIRLTDGSRIKRRFLFSDTLENLLDFVSTKEQIDNKMLATHYPRKVFTDLKITLEQAGLCPQGTIFVEEQL